MTEQLGIHSYISCCKKNQKSLIFIFFTMFICYWPWKPWKTLTPIRVEQILMRVSCLSGLQTGITTLIDRDCLLQHWLDPERLRKETVCRRKSALRRMSVIIELGWAEELIQEQLPSLAIAERHSSATLSRSGSYQLPLATVIVFPFASTNQMQTAYGSRFAITSTRYHIRQRICNHINNVPQSFQNKSKET